MISEYNFNLNPYYDDFSESKGFHRILFKPGFAVQARELTQIQTQIQNQIAKFGDHIFKDGSIVLGGNSFISNIQYISVLSTGLSTTANFESKTFEGQTSGAIGKISSVVIGETTSKIYFSSFNGNEFLGGETVIIDELYTTTVINEVGYLGSATSYNIQDSVFFVNGSFVFCESQSIIIAEGSPATCFVGLQINEDIITSVQDTSLLDPALGSYNYSAPGADRYGIYLELISFPYDPSSVDEQQVNNTNFIELTRIVDGKQVTLTRLPIYSEIDDTFARRTYDESGDYTVKAFNIKVTDHIFGNDELLSVQIDPGKCYIKGYEFETIAPSYIDLPKSRETIEESNFPVYVNYGNYFIVNSMKGDIDYTGNKVVNLYSSLVTTSGVIGNCTVRFVDYETFDGANTLYKLFVDNLNINAESSIANVRCFANNTLGFQSNVSTASYTSNVTVLGNESSSYILEIPKDNIKTLILDTESDTSYETIKRFTSVTFASNGSFTNATLTNPISNQFFIGSGSLSASDVREGFIVTVSSNAGGGPTVGTVLKYDDGLRINIVDENNIQLQYTGNYNFTTSVVAKISISKAEHKVKLLQTNGLVNIAAVSITNTISLLKSDCYKLDSVVAVSNTGIQYDYTTSYEFYTGQTDVLYDHGYVKLKTGYIDPVTANDGSISHIHFNFSYFTHSGTGSGFFNVDSYTSSGVSYSDAINFKSSNGNVYNLKNCIDFRPRRTDNSTDVVGNLLATPSSLIYCDFEHYIGRIDKLVITKERKFHIVKGIAGINPTVPTDMVDAMNLYIINIPAYTFSKDDIQHTFIENKRYTMRDIGRIEKRVEKLEYYTALSLLEKQAKDETIPSDIPTIERFKNGILVDSFAGHSVGDVTNPDYHCSIDYNEKILRPPFSSTSHTFQFDSGVDYAKNGDLVTLNYTTETLVSQGLASTFVNLNPYNIFTWNGFVSLNPPSDNWVDTFTKPDVTVNLNGENDVYTVLADNVDNPASSGVKWADWQTVVNGTPQIDKSQNIVTPGASVFNSTTTVQDKITQLGLEIKTGAVQTVTKDLGTKVVDTSIVPFIRSRIIDFSATGLKPKTVLYATFDDIDVTDYCFPATKITVGTTLGKNTSFLTVSTNPDVTGRVISIDRNSAFVRVLNSNTSIDNPLNSRIVVGDTVNIIVDESTVGSSEVSVVDESVSLVTDEFGNIAGSFLIPNSDIIKFRTGERLFKLTDIIGEGATTFAASKYVALGLSQSTEKTLVSTRISTTSIGIASNVTYSNTTISNTQIIQPPPISVRGASCNTTISEGGTVGTFIKTIDFGEAVGPCGINHTSTHLWTSWWLWRLLRIPNRYTITWDGIEYTTGFVGSWWYNKALNIFGHPNVIGDGDGQLRFNKTKAYPTTATLKIEAPIRGTAWRCSVVCPNESDISIPQPIVGPITYELVLSNIAASTYIRNPNASQKVTSVAVNVTLLGGTSTNFSGDVTLTTSDPAFTVSPSNFNLKNGAKKSVTLTFTNNVASETGPKSVILNGSVVEKDTSSVPTGVSDIAVTSWNLTSRAAPPRVDPVAQTFFIDQNQYPNGVFVDSVDIFFRTKSGVIPVMAEIRPTVNGYPSSKDVLPFSEVTLQSDNVLTSTDGNTATNFKFISPVYLASGEYAIVVKCNTDEYTIYSARIGDFMLNDPTTRITEQPAIGSMFKSQNSSTWTPIQEEDIKFKINKCVFDTSKKGEITLNSKFSSTGDEEFDMFFADGETLNFADTNIEYYFKTTDLNNNLDTNFTPYQLGSNVNLPSRRKIRVGQGSDLKFKFDITTNDTNITPVVDLARLSTVMVQNTINDGGLSIQDFQITSYGVGYSSNADITITGTNTTPASVFGEYNPNTGGISIVVTESGSGYTGTVEAIVSGGGASVPATVLVANERAATGGNGVARYITRKVTLAPGFESSDLKAYILANIPSGTSIKMYYKVAPITSLSFEFEPWYEMALESSGNPSVTGYVEYKYKTPGDTALPSGDRFKIFAIKILMYSNDSTKVPQLRDLRVIALDD
ncbi:DUF4815 domain-containing protein [Candidatus Dojkabacteria bacterium]|jgi:hypothetical protein|nr:DUF4815 domain-containing protein [Candidatus Dojkabacteria bacterium]